MNALLDIYLSLGKALPLEQQLFVSANWQRLADWLRTEEGKIAAQTFVQDWQKLTQTQN